jgi:histone H3/H4
MTDNKNTRYYKTYILKTLSQVSPDNSITTEGLNTVETALRLFCLKISTISHTLCIGRDSKTISDSDIKTAIKLFFPNELFNHGKEEIIKAILKYTMYENVKDEKVQRETKAGLKKEYRSYLPQKYP